MFNISSYLITIFLYFLFKDKIEKKAGERGNERAWINKTVANNTEMNETVMDTQGHQKPPDDEVQEADTPAE